MYKGIASSAGRVGHITGMQFDNISKTYAAENKQVRLNKTFLQWWLQINDIAIDRHKDALLSIEPTNVAINAQGKTRKIPRMHILTADRHAQLLRAEQELEQLTNAPKAPLKLG